MILDQFGNKITMTDARSAVRRGAQTSDLIRLRREFATHPVRGLTPQTLAATLESAEQGNLIDQHNLFLDMEERDAHIFAEMSKRRRVLLGLDWRIDPPRDPSNQEERLAEDLSNWLDEIDLDELILDSADAIGHGFSCLETEWQRIDADWLPQSISHRPQSWFQLDRDTHSQLRLRDDTSDGAELQPFSWLCHIHKAKPGYISRGGLHRVLCWPFLFKAYSVRDLAEFLEIYGLPLRVGTYPAGAGEEEKSTLLQAVVGIGHAAAGIIPQGMAVDFKEAAKGQSDPFVAMMDWVERSESKAILGATLTSQTDSGSGAYALGNVHNEVRQDLRNSDAAQLGATLTRDLLYPIAALNGRIDEPRRCPRFIFEIDEPEDIKLMSEALPPLVDIGVPIPVKWAAEKLHIPEPDGDESLLARGSAAPATAPSAPDATGQALQPPPAAAHRHLPPGLAALRGQGSAPDTADHLADNLERAAAPALDAVLAPIRRLVMTADSLEELRERIYDLYQDLPSDQLTAILTEAMAAAELAGRYEITEENAARSAQG